MSEPDVFDLDSREEAALSKEEQLRLKTKERAEDIQWLMGNVRGRRIVWGFLDKSGLRREPMTGNSQTFYNLGAMSLGRDLEGEIFAHCPELYTTMITENSL